MKIETQRTRRRTCAEPCDPASLQRSVRLLLSDKVSGNLVGLWLLIPEHLRLGTWDLLCGWSSQPGERVEPRLALQLVHEAALCSSSGLRHDRVLSQRGFELANGLPFVASDVAIHDLLARQTVVQSQRLQVALGRIRRASGDYLGHLLAIDPHRMRSYSKRNARRRKSKQLPRKNRCGRGAFCGNMYKSLDLLGYQWASSRISSPTSWKWNNSHWNEPMDFREGVPAGPTRIGNLIEYPIGGDYAFRVPHEPAKIDAMAGLAMQEMEWYHQRRLPMIICSHWHGLANNNDSGYAVHEKLLPALLASGKVEPMNITRLGQWVKEHGAVAS